LNGRSIPLIAIFLISAGAIGCEIVLMRLFSLIQWHHFAFMIISAALLGYGASGTFLTFARPFLIRHFTAAFRINALLFSAAAFAGFSAAQQLKFNPLEIFWAPHQLVLLGASYALLMPAFFFAANCIGLAFSRFGDGIGKIYAADLVGAGAGAIAAILLMMAAPAEFGLALVFAAGFAAAGCARLDRQAPFWIGAACMSFAALSLGPPRALVAPRISEYKGLSMALNAPNARIVARRHSPIGRIDVVASPEVPFRHVPGLSLASAHAPPEQLGLFVDGEGPQAIARFSGDPGELAYLDDTTEAAPYHAHRMRRVLVLGAGTGAAVLLGLYHRVAHIDAVEGDPFVSRLMRMRFADYAGHIYDRVPVRLHVMEARAFVAASKERYDLIQLPLSASRGGALGSLKEAYPLTREAIRAYLDRLAPGGMLVITREVKNPPRDSLKLIATAADALAARGIAEPARSIFLIHGWQTATLIVKKGAFTQDEIDSLRTFGEARSFDMGYYPGMPRTEANRFNILDAPYFYDGAASLLGAERGRFMRNYKFDLTPASDDRPFFDNFFKWSALSEQLALHRQAGMPLTERGYLILLAALIQAFILAAVLIVAPLSALGSKSGVRAGERTPTFFYFAALGLSFLFIEMMFIQRFTLFFGHPIYAISVVLASFLVFAGAGASFSARAETLMTRRFRVPALLSIAVAIACIGLIYLAALGPLFDVLASLAAPFKAVAAALLIAPLAFLMGMPFPIGLARLSQRAPALVPWAWGVNGCASVLSPILAALLSLQWGFNAVVVLALALYLIGALIFPRQRQVSGASPA
jgi:spermidine synthase